MPDNFLIDPDKARKRLGLDDDDVEQIASTEKVFSRTPIKCAPRTGIGSRYPGKPVLSPAFLYSTNSHDLCPTGFRVLSCNSEDCT